MKTHNRDASEMVLHLLAYNRIRGMNIVVTNPLLAAIEAQALLHFTLRLAE